MSKLQIENLDYYIQNKKILDNIKLEIKEGEFVGIIGSNGSGKSTLLKNIYRIYKPQKGEIFIDDKDIFKMKGKEIAKKLGVLAQENSSEFDFKVEDVVKMGRYPYKSLFEDYSKKDLEIVDKMLKKVGMDKLKERNFNSLSGGEKQRVLIARALVQDAEILILDEPTNHLDVGYQLQIMDIVKKLRITTFAAIHDMNIAAMYCDYLILMKEGKIIKKGRTEEILTQKIIKEIFNVECHIGKNPITGTVHIFYISIHEHREGMGNGHVHLDGYTGVHKH
ncbi:ABC transporter ATP-binding protein [uncultured Clostridium sp.]|uniref:ABC transporter ATP-binding protein n=1 Tax=uncultured Clostridium sp. TaxID=59620 RepID=UPI002632A89D|nr:ABC transporter ATP-binding protein [uncultured Clostridium sp.]